MSENNCSGVTLTATSDSISGMLNSGFVYVIPSDCEVEWVDINTNGHVDYWSSEVMLDGVEVHDINECECHICESARFDDLLWLLEKWNGMYRIKYV